jgi:acetyltransferase-like isoleucine patch superfamily enzyme
MQRPGYYLSKAINKFRSIRAFSSPSIMGTASCGREMSVDIVGPSKIIIKDNVRFANNCGIAVITPTSGGYNPAELIIGNRTTFQGGLSLNCKTKVEIGADCRISWNVHILDSDFHQLIRENGEEPPRTLPIYIGDRVWIGARSTILKGVTIGPDSMVAAGSVVTKSFPSNSLIGGNPARLIKRIKGWR